jgi:hypothetical protein
MARRSTLILLVFAALTGCERRDHPLVPDQIPAPTRALTNVAPRAPAAPGATDTDIAPPPADTAPPPAAAPEPAAPKSGTTVPFVAPFGGTHQP